MGSKFGAISTIFSQKILVEKFSIKVVLKMSQLSIKMINIKTRVFFAELSMENL